ncbi:3-oxoacyl-ACP reductase [Acrocarpospora pleiomorpha]|uniref:3-oxoacyl-ACP reductase n=1 Tax=Acrocarpospora pleiomorpha TaxID=90975 RepID=A0A5M3XH08_9ACTN|nr:SDR family oxidoreductase [Acrocarpospora pleiomorpha]GES20817.1 3-oxoacyl-ACP reductase [Acrocarpospora pleiomorpha]
MSIHPGQPSGSCAVVTGAASGIGAATARLLGATGMPVLVCDVSPAGEEIAAAVAEAGGTAQFLAMDVSDESAWNELRRVAHREYGPVRHLVSNAYVVDARPVHELSLASWNRQLEVNLTAAYLAFRTLHEDLRATSGAVVLVSSVHALIGLAGHPAYAAAKAALVGLGRQLAVDYGPEVRVNTVLPGPIMSPAWDRVPDEDRRLSVEATVAKRFGEPGEVAAAIRFLLSDEASFITATTLVVDGGWSATKKSA